MNSLSTFVRTYWKYVAGAIVLIALGGFFYFGGGSAPAATITTVAADVPTEVAVSGTVVAAQNVDLGFAASGRVSGVYATVGQHVSAGALLANVDNGDLVAMVAQRRAAVAEAQANLDSLLSGTRPEQLAVATTAVASARAALLNALQSAYTASDSAVHGSVDAFLNNPRTNPKISFTLSNASLESSVENDRFVLESTFAAWAATMTTATSADVDTLAPKVQGYLTQVTTLLTDANSALNQATPDQLTSAATLAKYASSLATARTGVDAAIAGVTSSNSALASAEKNLLLLQAGATASDIAAARAAVAAAQADVASTQSSLAKSEVRAPFSGTVTRMDAKMGEIISPTASQISMQSDGVFQIETYVPEVSISGVAPGNTATTTLDAYGPDVSFAAKVVSVDPAETVTGGVPTYKTTLTFLTADPRIRSGMTANVTITTGTLHNAIVIPTGAIGINNGQSYVSTMQNGAVVDVPVATGISPTLGQTEVTSGLSAGAVVLLTPAP